VVLWDDSWVTKKATSALGDNYVEISPGGPDPEDPDDARRSRRRLRSGEPIPRVVEAASVDRVFRSIEHALPRLDDTVVAAREFIDEGRNWVAGPFVEQIEAIDRRLAAGAVSAPLADVDDAVGRFEQLSERAARAVDESVPGIDRGLDRATTATAGAVTDLAAARTQASETMGDVRGRLDELDQGLARAADLVDELGDGPPRRQGRLASLINDPKLGDDIADVAEAGADLVGSVDRLRTVIGFRTELHLLARQPRFYVTAEITAGADQFYLVEAEKGFDGFVPQVALSDAPGRDTFTRTGLIEEGMRFTAQWGMRRGRFAVRGGLKESVFGVGADAVLGGGRLRISLDAIESSFDRVPRIKVAAALAVFRQVYVIGGIDDALVAGGLQPVQPWPAGADVPTQFEEVHYGRDFFAGLELRFTDTDINRLLLVYGGVIAALLS